MFGWSLFEWCTFEVLHSRVCSWPYHKHLIRLGSFGRDKQSNLSWKFVNFGYIRINSFGPKFTHCSGKLEFFRERGEIFSLIKRSCLKGLNIQINDCQRNFFHEIKCGIVTKLWHFQWCKNGFNGNFQWNLSLKKWLAKLHWRGDSLMESFRWRSYNRHLI
jgi:hypothetical protein